MKIFRDFYISCSASISSCLYIFHTSFNHIQIPSQLNVVDLWYFKLWKFCLILSLKNPMFTPSGWKIWGLDKFVPGTQLLWMHVQFFIYDNITRHHIYIDVAYSRPNGRTKWAEICGQSGVAGGVLGFKKISSFFSSRATLNKPGPLASLWYNKNTLCHCNNYFSKLW